MYNCHLCFFLHKDPLLFSNLNANSSQVLTIEKLFMLKCHKKFHLLWDVLYLDLGPFKDGFYLYIAFECYIGIWNASVILITAKISIFGQSITRDMQLIMENWRFVQVYFGSIMPVMQLET